MDAAQPSNRMQAYTVIAENVDIGIEVRRSRFLARIRRVDDERSARAIVGGARREHRGAAHHCSAFVLGPAGRLTRSNDDGEPSGTAGAPMLEALTGRGVTDVVAVVTRYFGGIKLGTGGLVRAYGQAVSTALDAAGVTVRLPVVHMSVLVDIADAGRVQNALRVAGHRVTGVDYDARAALATLSVTVPADRAAGFARDVAVHTGGNAVVSVAGEGWTNA